MYGLLNWRFELSVVWFWESYIKVSDFARKPDKSTDTVLSAENLKIFALEFGTKSSLWVLQIFGFIPTKRSSEKTNLKNVVATMPAYMLALERPHFFGWSVAPSVGIIVTSNEGRTFFLPVWFSENVLFLLHRGVKNLFYSDRNSSAVS